MWALIRVPSLALSNAAAWSRVRDLLGSSGRGTAEPPFFNFQAAGWALMATGEVGALVPRRGYGWLRRRMVVNQDGRRRWLDLRRHGYARMLLPGGLKWLPVPSDVSVPSPRACAALSAPTMGLTRAR